jgi:PAS domain S-box-containing protein
MAGWNWIGVIHPEDVDGIVARWRACLATGEIFEYETRVRTADGEYRWMFHRKVPLRDANGNIVKWYGSSMDIDERKRAEEAVRRSEAYLAEAQRLSHTGSFGWKVPSGEIFWSDETFRIFEYDRSVKPTIDSVVQRVHPQDRADFQKVSDGASRGATDFEHTYRLLLPDGGVKHVHAKAHALQDAFGNREFVGAVTDITERKTSEGKLQRLVDAGILGIFIANLGGEIVEANQAFLQMFQYDRQDLVSGRLRWEDMTPPELRGRDQLAVTEALATGFFRPYEKQFFRKDGSRVPVLLGGGLFQDSNEGVSFVLDLSEQKRAEEKIRGQEIEFRQMLDLAPQHVAVFGPDGERLYANRFALDYLGLSLEEWRQISGHSFRSSLFVHPDDQERVARDFDAVAPGAPLANWRCVFARAMEPIAGSWFVLAHCATTRDRLRVGMFPRRILKTASRRKTGCGAKTSLSVKKSTKPRCLKRLSEHLPL